MSALTSIFRVQNVFVGTTADNLRVHINAELRIEDSERDVETVEHGHVNSPVTLSMTHSTYKGRKNIERNLESSGAGLEDVARVVTPAPGYTLAEVRELARIGTKWHLNTGRAGCAHMDLPKDTSYDARKGITCPETGYKYGAAWLTEELPSDVYDRFKELASKGEIHPHED
ncbi:hypothetical protein OG497_37915 [Streptomyces sp. NBC_01242]|uniref:hypothetical protein n=1 Tax=Streptomyces sp. NBC_01242 TaxID=2903795 RepID=UPI002250BD12|nr:hypothetical protein [Streptomyces sp. NBC_01242]MCX4799636.1 hypothetical protein [Streptomyces sp. NBC_01242]